IGHNWDMERGDTGWNQWLALSGWQTHDSGTASAPTGYTLSSDGKWDYKTTAQFHRDYGRTNPKEDWSTMWEAYYEWKSGQLSAANVARLKTKLTYIGQFFASQR